MAAKKKRLWKRGASERKGPKSGSAGEGRAAKPKHAARMLLFLAKFFAIYFFLTALVELADLSALTRLIAIAAAQPLGFPAEGSAILAGGKSFVVEGACTGLSSAAILAALVFALKKPSVGKKLAVFAAGLIGLLLLNIPRIMLVLFAAANGFDAYAAHVYTWFLMSGAILLLWYYGNKKIAKVKDFGEMI